MKTVQNKWNGKKYVVLELTDTTAFMKREDGSEFKIPKKEYFSNYFEKCVDKTK